MANKLTPPPPTGTVLDRWLALLYQNLTAAGQILWASVSKTGSNLTDIETRNHADLQNLNTASYTHLTATNHADLTDAGDSALHYHATDRARANHSGTQTAATISDFSTAADARVSAGVGAHVALSDPHVQYALESALGDAAGKNTGSAAGTVAAGDDARFLSSGDKTDLTDTGATTLHKHDHGGQDGLGDDDHSQYLLADGTRALSGTLTLKSYTIAAGPNVLPTAGTVGRTACVTDALAPTFLVAVVGGGAVKCPVFDNGTNWVAF